MGGWWATAPGSHTEDYMRHAATVNRMENQLPKPEETIMVFWPCDNGYGYFSDQDGAP